MATTVNNIVRSPYPDDLVPENKSLYTFLCDSAEEETLDLPYYLDCSTGFESTRRLALDQSRRLCNAFRNQNLGLRPGDLVAVSLPNCPEYLSILLGITEAGLVAVCFNPANTIYELETMTRSMSFAAIFTLSEQIEKLDQVTSMSKATVLVTIDIETQILSSGRAKMNYQHFIADSSSSIAVEPRDGNSLAIVVFSSGTTGLPKAVKLSHRNAISALMSWERIIVGSVGDSYFTVVPFFHVNGMAIILRVFYDCYKVASMPKFVPAMYVEAIKVYKPTVLFLPPTLMSFVATCASLERKDFVFVKGVVTGGAPLRESLKQKLVKKMGPRMIIQTGYGCSETFGAGTAIPMRLSSIGHTSIGQVLPNLEMKVVDTSTLKPLGPNEKGELCIRGSSVFTGYLNNEEATAKAFDSDGWYITGDFGYYDSEGFVYIEGRIKDLIKVHAYQVSPDEIENVIRKLDQVQETVVFGIEDEKYGEVPRALVVRISERLTEEDVLNVVQDNLVFYKQLRGGVRFVQQLPLSSSGKILRRCAREWDLQNPV